MSKYLSTAELIIKNRDTIQNVLRIKKNVVAMTASLIVTQAGIEVTKERLAECQNLLNQSELFKGTKRDSSFILICKMAISDDAAEYLRSIEQIYNYLGFGHWKITELRILSAMELYDNVGLENVVNYAYGTSQTYDALKKVHKWMFTEKDMPYAALIKAKNYDVNNIIFEIDQCSLASKNMFKDSNSRLILGRVLSLDKKPQLEKTQRTYELYNALKAMKCKYPTSKLLCPLGALATLDTPAAETASHIVEVTNFYDKQKGFGMMSTSNEERHFFAAMTVLCEECLDSDNQLLINQQEVCTITLITNIAQNVFH